jgi:hypothetical protein
MDELFIVPYGGNTRNGRRRRKEIAKLHLTGEAIKEIAYSDRFRLFCPNEELAEGLAKTLSSHLPNNPPPRGINCLNSPSFIQETHNLLLSNQNVKGAHVMMVKKSCADYPSYLTNSIIRRTPTPNPKIGETFYFDFQSGIYAIFSPNHEKAH